MFQSCKRGDLKQKTLVLKGFLKMRYIFLLLLLGYLKNRFAHLPFEGKSYCWNAIETCEIQFYFVETFGIHFYQLVQSNFKRRTENNWVFRLFNFILRKIKFRPSLLLQVISDSETSVLFLRKITKQTNKDPFCFFISLKYYILYISLKYYILILYTNTIYYMGL